MPLTYASMNTMLHHWLIEKKSFEQAVKTDPVLSMFYGNFIKAGGIGQTDIVKLHMGNTYQTKVIAEGGSFHTHAESGGPDVVDSSTIANKLLTSRLSMTGTQKRALENAVDKITGETLNDATMEFVDGFKNTLVRCVVGDGSGKLCYAYNASSSTTITLKDDLANTVDDGHWVWGFLYPGMKLDVFTLSTGVVVTNGDNNAIVSLDPVAGTVTLTDAVDCSTASTYAIRNQSDVLSSYAIEPDGVAGMVYSQNTHNTGATVSYLGKSAATYPRWTSLPINASSESLNVKMLDQAIYRCVGTPDFILCDPAVISQLRYEAESMKKLNVISDSSLGVQKVVYLSSKGPVTMLDPYYLYGTGRCYVLNSKTFRTKGTLFTPRMIRGKLECLQTGDIWFDDAISEFQNICVQRNANTYIYGCKAAW